ncbi:MAG: hypothetical protein HQ514_14850 [Rhodospirillales bacterium]|nr:hypothetical protein [Rhodospirillales bacterium]
MIRPFVRFLLGAALLAIASPSHAGAAHPGWLTAFACGKLPTPLTVEVDAQDDNQQSRQLKKSLIKALTDRKARITANAPLIVSLHVETVREGAQYKGRDLGEFSRGNRSDERTKFRMNLWSNRKDSVIGGRKDTLLSQGLNELHVAIEIHDKSNGQCVWQGQAKLDLDGRDEFSTTRQIIPLLVTTLGKTVRAEPLKLD